AARRAFRRARHGAARAAARRAGRASATARPTAAADHARPRRRAGPGRRGRPSAAGTRGRGRRDAAAVPCLTAWSAVETATNSRYASPALPGWPGEESRSMARKRGKNPRLEARGSLWITADGESLGGHGRMALLRAVAEQGSITQAAKAFGISYKAAWDAIDAMNRVAGEDLVERSSGGRGGGSTRLPEH